MNTKEIYDTFWGVLPSATIWVGLIVYLGVMVSLIGRDARHRRDRPKTLLEELQSILEEEETAEGKRNGIQCRMNVDLPIVLANFFRYQMEYYDTLYAHLLHLDKELRKDDPKYSLDEYLNKYKNRYFIYMECFYLFYDKEDFQEEVEEFRNLLAFMKQVVENSSLAKNQEALVEGFCQNENHAAQMDWLQMVCREQLYLLIYLHEIDDQLRNNRSVAKTERANLKDILKKVEGDHITLSKFISIVTKEEQVEESFPKEETTSSMCRYWVECGSFESPSQAQERVDTLKKYNFDAFYKMHQGKCTVQVGAFIEENNAYQRIIDLHTHGFIGTLHDKQVEDE